MPKPAAPAPDEMPRFLDEKSAAPSHTDATPALGVPDDGGSGFDNAAYLRANPDVVDAISRGDFSSGFHHYLEVGSQEGRARGIRVSDPRNELLIAPVPAAASAAGAKPAGVFESLTVSPGGGILLIGWLNDQAAPLENIQIVTGAWRIILDRTKIIRLRRPDAEARLRSAVSHPYGVLAFVWTGHALSLGGGCVVEYALASGQAFTEMLQPRRTDDVELVNKMLSALASASFLGNRAVEAIGALESGVGEEVLKANRHIIRRVCARPFAQRFSPRQRTPRGSIIVVLYGKSEFLFLQNALYAGLPGIDDYEFIYVSNSPEMAEALFKEAKRSDRIYGLTQTIVILPGNAGFGAANNVGVAHARSNRVLIVNPDVFPKDLAWARRHIDLIGSVRAEECRLFGVPLFYDDGSLMHGGMYFEIDGGLSFKDGVPHTLAMARVEHYGKGAPPDTSRYLRPRSVPAVGGAFMSIDRNWFDTLGGFSEDYVFGHYEDADLCLKSIDRGTAPWMQNIPMWHLEGKGSTRLPPHEGASLVNRWVFSRSWAQTIATEILGPQPRHPLLQAGQAIPPRSAEDVSAPAKNPMPPGPAAGPAAFASAPRDITEQVGHAAVPSPKLGRRGKRA